MKAKFTLILITIIVGTIIILSCSSNFYGSGDVNMEKIESSSNYIDGTFRNKIEWEQPGIFDWLGTLSDFLFMDNDRKPKVKLPFQMVDFSKFTDTFENQINVTWIGHSSILLNIDGYRIVIDPLFERKHTFIGPSRYNGKVPLNINDIPAVDLVLITHNHYDHLNKKSIQSLKHKTKQFIVPLGVRELLNQWKVPKEKIIEADWWNEFQIDQNLIISFTPTQHFSGRGLFDRNKALWGSYVIKTQNHSVYFSGDSGYFDGFKDIGEKYGPFDITFLECGAYNSKWHHVHMYPEETVKAHIDLKGKLLHPIHWGTFDLSLHSWYDPMIRIAKAADSEDVKLITPIVGETIIVNENLVTSRWWEEFIDNKNLEEFWEVSENQINVELNR
jgi:L-ascorbate metabolism protein UlaG (beta-lactamase superfamily)